MTPDTKAQVRTPFDFVNVSAQVQRQWLPMFYFVNQARATKAQAIEALDGIVAVYANSKANALERLRGQPSALSAAELAIFEYINGFYNPRRRHSALGWKAPWQSKERQHK